MNTTLRVRIRGKYATAITKIALDLGYEVVQPSDVIVSRFGIPINNKASDVTVKDSEVIPGGLVLIGRCDAVNTLIGEIRRVVGPELFTWRSRIPLHRVYLGVIKEVSGDAYKVDLGEVVGLLKAQGGYSIGDVLPVYVAKTVVFPGDELLLRPGIRVDTEYVSLIPGDKVTFSSHIKDYGARESLLSVSMKYLRAINGFGIKWRSSAQFLSEDEAERELRRAMDLLQEVMARSRTNEAPQVLQEGECVVEVALGANAKTAMDNVRNNVMPTIIGHHTYKSLRRNTELLDLVESLLAHCSDRRGFSEEFFRQLMARRFRVGILHIKLNGTIIRLGVADVLKLEPGEVVLMRRIKGGGYYDGLGLPKEDGDRAITCTSLGSNYLVHIYLDRYGNPKGFYININTPVEFTGANLMYIDLSVDLASIWGSGEVKVLDYDEFMNYVNMGIVPREVADNVITIINELRTNANNIANTCLSKARELNVSAY